MGQRSLLTVIEAEYRKFLKSIRQTLNPGEQNTKAMKLTFRTRLDYDKEDGYREMEVLLFTPNNYTAVCVRNTWDVTNNLDDEDERDYISGATPFCLRYYHDSCWGEGLEDALKTPGSDIVTSFDSWYDIVEFDLDLGHMQSIYHVSDLKPLTFNFNESN